ATAGSRHGPSLGVVRTRSNRRSAQVIYAVPGSEAAQGLVQPRVGVGAAHRLLDRVLQLRTEPRDPRPAQDAPQLVLIDRPLTELLPRPLLAVSRAPLENVDTRQPQPRGGGEAGRVRRSADLDQRTHERGG